MPKRIQLPDGTIGEFPDSMSDDQIKGVLKKKFPPKNTQPSRLERFESAIAPSDAPSGGETYGQFEMRQLKEFGKGMVSGVEQIVAHPIQTAKAMGDQVVASGWSPNGYPIFAPTTGNRDRDQANRDAQAAAQKRVAQSAEESSKHPAYTAGTFVGPVVLEEGVRGVVPRAFAKLKGAGGARLRSAAQRMAGTDSNLTDKLVTKGVKQQTRLNEGAERANANAAEAHANRVSKATTETEAANRKTAEEHQTKIRETHATNEAAKAEHALESEKVAEENRAQEHQLELRRNAEQEITTASRDLEAKVDKAGENAKAANDADWAAVREKTGQTPADVTHVRAVTEQAVEMSDPTASPVFKSILREDEAARPVHVNGTQIGPENQAYGKIYESLYGEPPPLGKTVTFDKLHRWYNYLGEKMYSGSFKDAGTFNALRSVRNAINDAMGEIASKTGATDLLQKARESHTRYTETFRDSPNEPATVASKVVSETDAETAKARKQAERMAKVAQYDPSIATDAARIKGLRDHLAQLPSEEQLRKGLKPSPDPPKVADRPGAPEFKETPKIEPPKQKTARQVEVNLKEARREAITERARQWGSFNKRDVGNLLSSIVGDLIIRSLFKGSGFESAAMLAPIAATAYEGGTQLAARALTKPKVVEWLSRAPKDEIDVINRIPGHDKIKIVTEITQEAQRAASQGQKVTIAPAVAALLGASNVALIKSATPKTPGQMKKEINAIRERNKPPVSSNPGFPNGQ